MSDSYVYFLFFVNIFFYFLSELPSVLINANLYSFLLLMQTVVHEGGLVPKSMYQPGEEVDGTRQHIPLSDQSMYHSVSLGRGQVCLNVFFFL